MTARYTYAADAEVLNWFCTVTKRDRTRLLRIFHALADDPFQRGNHQRLRPGRQALEVKAFGPWTVHWWVDHPVCLVRIIEIHPTTALA